MSYTPKSKYVPTTDQIETAFHEFASNLESKWPGEYAEAPEFADWVEAMHGFKRWHAEEIRKAKEEVWDEVVNVLGTYPDGRRSPDTATFVLELDERNPYRKEQND